MCIANRPLRGLDERPAGQAPAHRSEPEGRLGPVDVDDLAGRRGSPLAWLQGFGDAVELNGVQQRGLW